MTETAAGKPDGPVVAINFTDELRQRVEQHPSRPIVLDYTKTAAPWEVPPEAELLMAFHAGWQNAPKQKPAGWPFGLKQINVLSAGVDRYPAWFFDGVAVTCGRGVSAIGIAEFVTAAMLCREKRFIDLANGVKVKAADIRGIADKTVGLLGLGAIGLAVARRALALEMRVVARSRSGGKPPLDGVEMVDSTEALFARSDHLVVAVPLTPQTRGIVDAGTLSAAKAGLHLINVARGELIDQEALLAALEEGRIGFATLDVTTPEPLPAGHPLLEHPNVMVTPHISWAAEDNFDRLVTKVYRDLDRYLAGLPPLDRVDRSAGY